ncbi:hypothetical protein GCM10025857_22580 [Alicyclobacillus contaminans]|uniref:stage II sporulation protein R n=1 Tax=Alicyclobacillus contaminans TaxID=392016 RepID=UPI0003FE1401|nr:stage II sporulation protein R [Alicyclobacillus contaminans]GMA50901.1 hypothetical protein GCM10025857_22580 [Alicyclobacillus contaminans]
MAVKRMMLFLCAMVCVVAAGRMVMHQQVTAAPSEDAAPFDVAEPHGSTIPSDALRLRIIANSDSAQDQEVKREVRDAVVVQVGELVKGAKTAAEAKARVEAALPELRQTALEVTRRRGYDYPVTADVGKVPFPTKVYGNQVYPAGNYEALRITLGAGRGQNWWCVLFPPLCFVDIADGDAVPNTGQFPDLPPLETIQVTNAEGQKTNVQVRLAAVDYGETAWKAIQHLWNHH